MFTFWCVSPERLLGPEDTLSAPWLIGLLTDSQFAQVQAHGGFLLCAPPCLTDPERLLLLSHPCNPHASPDLNGSESFAQWLTPQKFDEPGLFLVATCREPVC